jgi:hypothetical protein
MARISTAITSFNGGEITPLLDARIDLDFYSSTAKNLLNFIPTPQGPIKNRMGFRYVATTKTFGSGDASRATRLYPFVFAVGDVYMLEFGNQYIRFYQNQAQIESGGSPLELSSPYLEADLFDLQFAQVNDLLYIVHGNYAPRVLSRTAVTPTFSLDEVDFQKGPTLDENETATTLTASATTGTVTITASTGIFNANMVGGVWAISEPSGSLGAYTAWVTSTAYTAGAFRRNDGRVYVAASSGTSGTIPPVHTRGTVSDGGVNWTYVNDGTGYIKFETYNSSTSFSGTVQVRLPNTVTSTATTYWNEGAWSDDQGWPSSIVFYEQRAFYGGTTRKPQTIWASRTNGDFENFDTGAGLDDEALTFELSSQSADSIKWLASKNALVVGTAGGVFVVKPSTVDQIITPSNVQAKQHTDISCSNIAPELVGNYLMFGHRAGKKLFSTAYNFETDSFQAEDLTVRANYILEAGIKDIAYQQEPSSILWLVLNDGTIAALTIEQGQKVAGWHRHTTSRMDENGNLVQEEIESIATIPTNDTDELWIVSKRTIGSATVRFVEILEPNESRRYHLDAGVYYSGTAVVAGNYGGFDHLAGERVRVLLAKSTSTTQELAVTDDQTVSGSGEIVLPYDCTKIAVGLPYNSDYESHRMLAQTEDGINLSKPTRINKLYVRLYKTLGLQVGPTSSDLYTIPFRFTSGAMDNPPTLFGQDDPKDYEIDFNGDWDSNRSTIFIRQAQPYPATILSLSAILNANTK